MIRKSALLIVAGIVLIGIFKLVGTKRQHPSDGGAVTAQTAKSQRPFRDSRLFSPPTDLTFAPLTETMAEQLNHHKSAPWMRIGPEVAF